MVDELVHVRWVRMARGVWRLMLLLLLPLLLMLLLLLLLLNSKELLKDVVVCVLLRLVEIIQRKHMLRPRRSLLRMRLLRSVLLLW